MGRRPRLNAITGATAALALGLLGGGCGGSQTTTHAATTASTASATTASKTTPPKEHLPTVSITLASPVFSARTTIPARYTCDGTDTSPPMHWSGVPSGTAEFVLIISELSPSASGGEAIAWAVAGLPATLKRLSAGPLPAGAIVGRNSLGQARYSVCPPTGVLHHYIVVLYALPHTVSVQPGFAASALVKTAQQTAEYKGLA